jgi:hypothetical protein
MKHLNILFAAMLALPVMVSATDNKLNRGIGIYPGNPDENFAPELVPDNTNYRNVALLRSAYQSSIYDYNLTAQLITDGRLCKTQPATIEVSTASGPLQRREREWLFDGKVDSHYRFTGTDTYLQLALKNCTLPTTKISLRGSVTYGSAKGFDIECLGSNDGQHWTTLGTQKGDEYPGTDVPMRTYQAPKVNPNEPQPSFHFDFPKPQPTRNLKLEFSFAKPVNYAYYRIQLKMAGAQEWSFSDWDFYSGTQKQLVTPSKYFNSAWMSLGSGTEWVYVDLGAKATFDKLDLYWINKATAGEVQVSDDAANWTKIATLTGGAVLKDEIKLAKAATGRYVRLLMTRSANGKRYVLSEMEVWGKGGLVARPKTTPAAEGSKALLDGGQWRLQRASDVKASGELISSPTFKTEGWILATVPGTVLSSYHNIGALPDPNYSDNQLQISESFFNSNFWYRRAFTVPASFNGGRLFLNFDGINWKANIFLNGKKIGRIEGAFMHGKFDVTNLVKRGAENVLAVEIIKNVNIGAIKEQNRMSPDQNGGILGADNPTFHSSIGWDWIPTIRGRNIGIWNDVYLTHSGAVTIENPFVRAELPLPDTTSARVLAEVTLVNHEAQPVSGVVKGMFGNVSFEKQVTVAANKDEVVKFTPEDFPQLKLDHPTLWWPKGYGAQYLYNVSFRFEVNGNVSDAIGFKSGIRQMTFDDKDGVLKLYVNGRRFIGRGGNWGFGESNLNYRGREYDAAVGYHADMNFTMIRNWVGQIGDEEFYDACDKYGVMVWQDFWLANPADGPDPDDNAMFMANAKDYVMHIRNHASIGLYVGRNEGNPPAAINNALDQGLPIWHPGIHYIPNSAGGVVSGGGPYRALPPRDYYLLYGKDKFHSERGMPNVMNWESLKLTFNPDSLWPQSSQWGMHDYTLEGAQAAASFNQIIEKAFGQSNSAEQFADRAQWINYNGYRGMFEGRSSNRKGLLLWMSHPCWPSMVWQTYDYYLDPTAAYFGCKKANEPLHVLWNPVDDTIEVVNYSAGSHPSLTVTAQVLDMNGTKKWEQTATVGSNEDTTVKCFKVDYPSDLTDVYFIKLTMTENGKTVSENVYWKGKEDGNYQALNALPKTNLTVSTDKSKTADGWQLTTTLKNDSSTPALMVRLKVVDNKGERMLPVYFSDNYLFLFPGESKTVTMRLNNADTRGEEPQVAVLGFNL